MPARLTPVTTQSASAEQQALLAEVRHQFGRVPNLHAAMATGPSALRGYLALRDSLAGGVLDADLRQRLALLISQENHCGYCISAHTALAQRMGFKAEDLTLTRRAEAADEHTQAVLSLARDVVRAGGNVTDDLLAEVRAHGVSDEEMAETVAHVALNVLSNYFSHLARPDLDFPVVDATRPASPTPPRPPFTLETAAQKVQAAEDAWNTRDPERVSLAYTENSVWRNRETFVTGRAEIVEFLTGKWERELDYSLRKSLWGFRENRMAVRFQYEWHNAAGEWFRSYGNELWEFDASGLMSRREASINDVSIAETERRYFGPRPADERGPEHVIALA